MTTFPSSLSIALHKKKQFEKKRFEERTSFREDNDEHIHRHHVQQHIELMVLYLVRVNEEAF